MKIEFDLDDNFNLNSDEIKKRALDLDSKVNKILFPILLWLLAVIIIIFNFTILGKSASSSNKVFTIIFIASSLLYLALIFNYCNDWYNYTHCMLECDFVKNLLSSIDEDGFIHVDDITIGYSDFTNKLYIRKIDDDGVLKYCDKISINKLCEHDKDYWLIKGYLNDKGLYQFDAYKPVNISY